ncbi:MAG: hypothetical protein GF401_00630 [Chitinivibrionales bacterium]|nr:hypothetical protein [Chitinivibrionales bacterium]
MNSSFTVTRNTIAISGDIVKIRIYAVSGALLKEFDLSEKRHIDLNTFKTPSGMAMVRAIHRDGRTIAIKQLFMP